MTADAFLQTETKLWTLKSGGMFAWEPLEHWDCGFTREVFVHYFGRRTCENAN